MIMISMKLHNGTFLVTVNYSGLSICPNDMNIFLIQINIFFIFFHQSLEKLALATLAISTINNTKKMFSLKKQKNMGCMMNKIKIGTFFIHLQKSTLSIRLKSTTPKTRTPTRWIHC